MPSSQEGKRIWRDAWKRNFTRRRVRQCKASCANFSDMQQTLSNFDAIASGIECPKCHTVYFLDGEKNRDRMYHYSGEDGQEHWKLLCICSEQTPFTKKEIRRYSTTNCALQAGWAVRGQWRSSTRAYIDLVTDRLRRKIEVSRHAV